MELIGARFYGNDAEGRPIIVVKLNGQKVKKFYTEHTIAQTVDIMVMIYERIERIVLPMCTKKFGKLVGKRLWII